MNEASKSCLVNLEVAERQLDRIQSFFPRIDSKVSALFAIASGQIAIAAVNLSFEDLKLWWITVPATAFLLTIGWTILNLYWCTYPHLNGGSRSLVYFSEIAKLREPEYLERYTALTEERLKADIVGQIWRNSEIVSAIYRYLKHGTAAAMLSLIPWTALLVATSLSHWKLPVVG